MRPESLDFGVKRFCGCIGQPVLEVVDNGVIVVFKGFNDLAESVVSECFHAVVPSGEVKPCRGRGGLPVENVHKFKVEVVRPLQHGEHPEQHAGPFPLLRVPFGFVGEKQVFAARHDLRPGLAVLHPFRLPFPDKVLLPPRARGPAPGPEFLDGLVLLGEHLPAEVYPHVVDGLGHEPLHVETVVYQPGAREHGPGGEHHGRRQVGGHGLHPAAYFQRDEPEYGGHRVGGHPAHHRGQRPFPAASGLVGQDRIDLAAGQAGLVEAHVPADVVREEHVFRRMPQLLPAAVTADFFLVLLAQRLPVEAVAGGERGDAHRRGFNLLLLKKRRTRRSSASRRTRTVPSHS